MNSTRDTITAQERLGQFDPKPKNPAAVALGRLGGLSRSPKKRKGSAEMRRIRLIGWAKVRAAKQEQQ